MADDFETQLDRLFSQPPAFPDGEAFVTRVTTRLDRDWTMRRMMIGVGGLAAGMVVAWQFLAGRFGAELASVSDDARGAVDSGLGRMLAEVNHATGAAAGSETLWLVAGLAAAAVGFAVTRVMESY